MSDSTVTLLPNARQQFVDGNGAPLVGGTVTTYVPNTSTPKTTWSDPAGTIPNANPLTLDSLGSATIWADGAYRQVVKDSLSNLVWDNVTLAAGGEQVHRTLSFRLDTGGTAMPATAAAGGTAMTAAITIQATLPSGAPLSFATADIAATADTTLSVNHMSAGDTTTIGTITFGAGQLAGVLSGFASDTALADGDTIQIPTPASPDATLSGITIGLDVVQTILAVASSGAEAIAFCFGYDSGSAPLPTSGSLMAAVPFDCTLTLSASSGVASNGATGNTSFPVFTDTATGVVSGTYNSGTGAVSLTLSSPHGIVSGGSLFLFSMRGTGSFANLNGVHTATTGTTGSVVNFTAASGLTLTISGGSFASGVGSFLFAASGNGKRQSANQTWSGGVLVLSRNNRIIMPFPTSADATLSGVAFCIGAVRSA